jgi:hypothetical protein
MKKANVILLTLLGLSMNATVAFFSWVALDISDGHYADRLARIIASLDPATQSRDLWTLTLCRWCFLLSAQLPLAEIAACVLGVVALVVYLARGARSIAAPLYLAAFLLPLLVVAPLLIAAPLSSSLTRAEGAGDFAFLGSYLVVVWVLFSGLSFSGASSASKIESPALG